jgi:hypothetical protein
MPERFQDRWNRVVRAISTMRSDRVSLPRAAREFGLSRGVLLRLARTALRKQINGRYASKLHDDRLLRVEAVPTPEGLVEVGVPNFRQASQLGKYWNAVHRYLETGDKAALQKYHGQHITDADGTTFPLLTDLDELDRLGSAGVLTFETIYARGA